MSTRTSTAAVVRAGEGREVAWGHAGTIRILGDAESTEGTFSIVEANEEPGSAAPLHVHHGEAEIFYIVEGALELTCGEQTVAAGAGDLVYAPKDVPHKYTVVGDRPARVLLIFSRPGFEEFFAETGTPVDGPHAGPPDREVLRRLVEKYDMELLEAPGTEEAA
jgi:mannose-6-phosphate isomerase-like protein (cupin superfamily)